MFKCKYCGEEHEEDFRYKSFDICCDCWEPDNMCPECGEPCKAVACDSGIGFYECHGAKGYDSRPYVGSDCCEAGMEVELDGDDGYADYLFEQERDRRLGLD